MKKRAAAFPLIAACLGMLCLILDSRCAAEYARESLLLCLKTVIPGLFPMFVLSGMVVSQLFGTKGSLLSGLERLLGLPSGSGSIFLLGAVGGFPVGAQCIAQSVGDRGLSKADGERLLGFCNNCGPAFLFGILGSVFADPAMPLLVFLIQLESALVTAALWRGSSSRMEAAPGAPMSLSQAVSRAVRSMVSVCAWVILAGVVTGFLKRWLFPFLPEPVPEIIAGPLELTGGVLGLASIESDGLRFILCCIFVCFGGVSVLLQIQSIAGEKGLSAALCLRQKAVQGLLGGVLGAGVLSFGPVIFAIPVLFVLFWKKPVEISGQKVYNSPHKGGF